MNAPEESEEPAAAHQRIGATTVRAVALLLLLALLGFLAVTLSGACTQAAASHPAPSVVQGPVVDINGLKTPILYVQDPQHDLCFAVLRALPALAAVPCSRLQIPQW